MNEEFKEKLDIINCLCNETFSISVALFDKWLKLTRNNWSTTEFGINFAFGVLAIFFYLVWRFRIEICSCVKILRKILISSYHVIERVEGVICYLFTYIEFSAVSLFGSKCPKNASVNPLFWHFSPLFTEKRHSRTDPTVHIILDVYNMSGIFSYLPNLRFSSEFCRYMKLRHLCPCKLMISCYLS